MNSLFLQGFVFSTLAVGVLAVLAWWLFLSPQQQSAGRDPSVAARGNHVIATSPQLSLTLALLIGIGALLIVVGGYWDLSEHVVTGIVPGGEDFLWPPHLMLYAGFLLAFLVAVGGLVALAVPNLRVGVLDPRRWVRRSPYVGAIVLIASYGLFSIPGDAIWHELYGVDLTGWSPPHIFLALASAGLAVFAAGLLRRRGEGAPRPSSGPNARFHQFGAFLLRADWRNFVKLFYLVLAFNLLIIIGTVEWEVVDINNIVAQRPVWLYPTIIGVISFFLLILARRIAPSPWTATVTALLYFGFRIAVSVFADVVSGAPPRLTLVFILGALLLDLTCQRMERAGIQAGDTRHRLAAAGVFTAGYALIALPTIQFYLLQFLPAFAVSDHLLTVLFTFLLNAALYPVAAGLGGWLQRSRWEEAPAPRTMPSAVSVPAEA